MKTSAIAVLVLSAVFAGAASADETTGVEGAKGNKGNPGQHSGARMEKCFDKIDTNHDGQISKDEFIAFREKIREHRKQKNAK